MYSEEITTAVEAFPVDSRPRDEKGRIVDLNSMSERELLMETVAAIRFLADKSEAFIQDLPNNPMFKMLGKFF